jgi:hypothetical protein
MLLYMYTSILFARRKRDFFFRFSTSFWVTESLLDTCWTPLEERATRRQGLYLHRKTQKINTTDRHPRSPAGFLQGIPVTKRPVTTPQTARPPGSAETRLKLYKTLYAPRLLYGSKFKAMTERNRNCRQTTETRTITRPEKLIRQDLKVQNINEKINEYRINM